MKNPKTTIAAVLSAVAVVCVGVAKFLGGQPVDYPEIVLAITAILQAIGLYKAADPS
jgi:hypothetical protein